MAFVIPSIFTAVDKMSPVVKAMGGSLQELALKAQVSSARAERSLTRIGGAADSIFNKIVNVRTALAAGFVIGGAVKVFNMTADLAAMGDELATTAGRIGLTTQALQEFQYAAKLQNIESETLIKSFEKLNKNLGDLHRGQGTLHMALKKSNPALERQLKHAKDAEAAYTLISAAIIKLPNQMDRAALAQAAFGKAGQEMLNLIMEGPETLQKMRDEAQRLGFVLSDEAVAAAQKFDDANDRMNFTLQGLKVTIGSGLIPIVSTYIEKATSWILANRELVKQKVTEFAGKVTSAIEWLAKNIDKVILGTKLFVGALIALKVISVASTLAIYGMRAATVLYNVALGISTALQGKSAFYVMQSKIAYAAYRVVVIATTSSLWAANAASIALGVALTGGLSLAVIGIYKLFADSTPKIDEYTGALGGMKKGFTEITKPIDEATIALARYNGAIDEYNKRKNDLAVYQYEKKHEPIKRFAKDILTARGFWGDMFDEDVVAPKKSDFPGLREEEDAPLLPLGRGSKYQQYKDAQMLNVFKVQSQQQTVKLEVTAGQGTEAKVKENKGNIPVQINNNILGQFGK